MRKQKLKIPVVDLNDAIPEQKQNKSPHQIQKPLPQPLSQSKLIGAGGFRIPSNYKGKNQNQPQPEIQPTNDVITQMEIFQELGLKPYSMEQSTQDKQRIAHQINGPLVNHPISQSKYFDANLQLIHEERKQLQNQIDAKHPNYSPNYEEIPEEVSFQEKLNGIQEQISHHYNRIAKLEKEFMPQKHQEYDESNYQNIKQKLKQLQDEKKKIKEDQRNDRQEYEEERRRREQRVQVQIEEFKKQKKQQKLIKPKEKVFQNIEAKTPEQQIYEHQFQEFKQEKILKQTVEKKMKDLDRPAFDKYKNPQSFEKQPPKQNLPDQVISHRPVTVVSSLKELHQIQLAGMTQQQLNNLDPQMQKSLFKNIVEDKIYEQQINQEKNEQFVLNFTFTFIDKDNAGFISKSEAKDYLMQNKDIQVIFTLDLKTLSEQIDQFNGRRAGMLDFNEYSQLLRKCKETTQQNVAHFKEKAILQIQNREEAFHQAYQMPLKDIFKLLDIRDEGVVGRVEFVKSVRNNAAKHNSKLLSLPISQDPGSPNVNQVLERILSDYRKKPENALISWNQLLSYFEEPIPTSELGLLQARIILAHFGPGSIASEGYYQKMKNRCILQHQVIQQILECFMKVDSQCDLIIEKMRLIEEIRIKLESHLDQPAAYISQINKYYTLNNILNTLQESIIDEKNDSQYISLQQFTEMLTNYSPPPPKLPQIFFNDGTVEGEKPKDCLTLCVKEIYFQILQDCFDMVPRVFNNMVLKEEFIQQTKKDPQMKCLLGQQARNDGETIGQVLHKLQQQEVQLIQWADVVYLFSDKASIYQQEELKPVQIVREPFNSNLRRSDFFMFNPVQKPQSKVVERVIQGPAVGSQKLDIFTSKGQHHSDEENREGDEDQNEEGNEFLNNSFDQGDLRQMKVDYDSYAERIIKMRNTKRSITVPKQPLFQKHKRKTIRQKRLEKMIEEIEEKEEFEINNKFRANPIQSNLNIPMQHIIAQKAMERKMKTFSQQDSKPFSFYYKDLEKMEKKKIEKSPPKLQQFKAKEVPINFNMEIMKQKEIEDKKRREELKEKRKEDLINNTQMPARLQEADKKRLEKLEKQKNLKPSDIDPECKFNPKIKKLPPKIDDGQKEKNDEKVLQKKQEKKRDPTEFKSFNLSEAKPKQKPGGIPTYLDEDNQRKKVKEEPQKKVQKVQQVVQEENEDLGENEQEQVSGQEEFQAKEESNKEDQEEQIDKDFQEEQPQQDDSPQQEVDKDQLEEEQIEEKPEEIEKVKFSKQESQNKGSQNKQLLQEQLKQQPIQKPPSSQKMDGKQSEKSVIKSAEKTKNKETVPATKIIQESQKPVNENSMQKKEKKKVLSSQERELQMLQEQKEKKKQDQLKAQAKLDPSYQQKLKDLDDRMNQRDLMVTKKQHGSTTLAKYKQLAQKQAEQQSQNKDNDQENEQLPVQIQQNISKSKQEKQNQNQKSSNSFQQQPEEDQINQEENNQLDDQIQKENNDKVEEDLENSQVQEDENDEQFENE